MLVRKAYTLVFIRNETHILLGLKKRGFGVNKWNGFGGKVDPDEEIIDAAVREVKEECCVDIDTSDLKHIGHLEFTFEKDPVMMDVNVFSATVYRGTPTETEEMKPKWYSYDRIPYDDMWPDDRIWFPTMIQGKSFYGRFHYQGFDKILYHELDELDSMETFYDKRNREN